MNPIERTLCIKKSGTPTIYLRTDKIPPKFYQLRQLNTVYQLKKVGAMLVRTMMAWLVFEPDCVILEFGKVRFIAKLGVFDFKSYAIISVAKILQ